MMELKRTIRFRPDEAAASIGRAEWQTAVAGMAVIAVGSGIYGASIGLWRSPLQAVFVAIKMPLLIFATLSINAVLNGVLAALLGSGLTFRQTAMAILQSFALFSLMVGALGPQVDVDGGGRGRNGVRRSLTYESADST